VERRYVGGLHEGRDGLSPPPHVAEHLAAGVRDRRLTADEAVGLVEMRKRLLGPTLTQSDLRQRMQDHRARAIGVRRRKLERAPQAGARRVDLFLLAR